MDKDVRRRIIRSNKSEAFYRIKEFNGTFFIFIIELIVYIKFNILNGLLKKLPCTAHINIFLISF